MFSNFMLIDILNYIDFNLIYRIILALLFGFVLGLEREYRAKPAGIKTYALICLGSTIITYVSISFSSPADPSRMAAQIVSGLGFIGAGTIFQSKRIITGLTTASSLWVVGALGIMIGVGLIIESAIILFLIYLYFIFSRLIVTKNMRRFKYSITIALHKGVNLNEVDEIFNKNKIEIQFKSINKLKNVTIETIYLAKKPQNDKFIKQLVSSELVKKVEH